MKSGIYSITNKIDSKIYIGQALDISSRWKVHRRDLNNNDHHNIHLQRAWNKYGESSFIFEVVEECSEDHLYSREHYWVTTLYVTNRKYGYNIQLVDPNGKCRHSEESKQKISESNKGKTKGISRKKSLEESIKWRERISRPHTEEHKRKVSEAKRGKKRKFSTEWIENLKKSKPLYNLYNKKGEVVYEKMKSVEIAKLVNRNKATVSECWRKSLILARTYMIIRCDVDQQEYIQNYLLNNKNAISGI